MATLNPSLYYQVAEHIKLQLQTRGRDAPTSYLDADDGTRDGGIARGLNDLLDGVEKIEREVEAREEKKDPSAQDLRSDASSLRELYRTLDAEFRGYPIHTPASSNNNTLPVSDTPSQSRRNATRSASANKTVRFTDTPSSDENDPSRDALFPYRDNPAEEAGNLVRPTDNMANDQILSYHDSVMREQDEQLDVLGQSIGRQRQLGEMIGEELDEHVQMLEEVDVAVDRQQGRLNGARQRIGQIARKANDNKQITTIVVLIVILVLLIIILKT